MKHDDDVQHVVLGTNSFRCLHCGEEFVVPMPCRTETLIGAGYGFQLDHARCTPSAAGRARWEYKTVQEWLDSWDTSTASMVIYRHMSYLTIRSSDDWPRDADDFGRCVRLLDVAGGLGWRWRMHELAARPGWGALVNAWDELEGLYRTACETGDWKPLNARMRELVP